MIFLDTINAAFTNNNGTASSNLREQAPHSVRTYRAGSAGASRALYCGTKSKTRQTSRIRELGSALAAEGLVTLDEQARALDLSRSTAWAVLKANHKASGLTAATINRMLSSPELPARVRATILTYVEEKLAGLYGHNNEQLSRFAARCKSSNRDHAPENRANSVRPAPPTVGKD